MKVIVGLPLKIEADVSEVSEKGDGLVQIVPKIYSKKTSVVNILSVCTKDDKGNVHYRGKIKVNVRTGAISVSNEGSLVVIPCPLDTGNK